MDSMMQRILRMEWSIPADVEVSPECRDLLCKLLVGDPRHRLTMAQIQVNSEGSWSKGWHIRDVRGGWMEYLGNEGAERQYLVANIRRVRFRIPSKATGNPALALRAFMPCQSMSLPHNPGPPLPPVIVPRLLPQSHPWFLTNLPPDALAMNDNFLAHTDYTGVQSEEDITRVLASAAIPAATSRCEDR